MPRVIWLTCQQGEKRKAQKRHQLKHTQEEHVGQSPVPAERHASSSSSVKTRESLLGNSPSTLLTCMRTSQSTKRVLGTKTLHKIRLTITLRLPPMSRRQATTLVVSWLKIIALAGATSMVPQIRRLQSVLVMPLCFSQMKLTPSSRRSLQVSHLSK
jgi:hypothetical protein